MKTTFFRHIFATIALLFGFAQASLAESPRVQVMSKAAQSAAAASGVASAATATISVTVPGAALGDACVASHSTDTTGLVLGCAVTAANTAKVTVLNHTTNGVALTSGTTRVFLLSKGVR